MNLIDLSVEYRNSGEKCRERAKQLHKELNSTVLRDSERLILRRRLTILEAMARETIEISNILKKYYGKRGHADNERLAG